MAVFFYLDMHKGTQAAAPPCPAPANAVRGIK